MSYVIAAPDMLAAAATDLAGIGSSLSEANTAAAASTTRVIAAAADEVSAAIASLFSSHGTAFQALSAQAADFHSQFVQALNSAKGAYAAAEAANAGLLQTVAQALPVPNVSVSLLNRTLVQLGTAHASGYFLAVAVGANSDATVEFSGLSVAFALGANSDATVLGSSAVLFPTSGFNSAIAVGTNDVATAGGSGGVGLFGGGVPGSHDHAFVLGTGSTAHAGVSGAASANHDFAAVLGNMQTATATGADFVRDIVTPFGTWSYTLPTITINL